MGLKELIAHELESQDFAHVNLERLYEAAKDTRTYTSLGAGIFITDDPLIHIGVMGDWPKEEKNSIKAIQFT